MANSNPTQCERILKYIEEHGSITQQEAMNDLGIMRLASRVSEINKDERIITGKMIKVKNRFGETCRVKQYSMGGAGNG